MRKALEADMARSALRLERERHNVQSMTIAMKERDGLMDEIRQHLAAMCDDGSISRSAWDSIERKMRMSELTRREWDELQEMYARTHPHFFDLLRARYPALTDGDVWLAFYISAGLASKDIARVTHLQPNSIKKNRQRLRRRMGIASEVSLEEVLRSIRSEPPAQGKGPEPASADSGPLKGTCAVSGGTP